MFEERSALESTRLAAVSLGAVACALLLLTTPAVAQEYCYANCDDCPGVPSNSTQDCAINNCAASGQTVACEFGCCLDSDMAFCMSFNGGQPYFYYINCGIQPPGGWLTDDPETLKWNHDAGACLDIGINPEPRADGHADWVVVEMDPVGRLTAGDARVRAGSSGIQALLPELDPAVLAARMDEIRIDMNKVSLEPNRGGVMVGIYPPLQSQSVDLDLSSLDNRKVTVDSAEALFEIELNRKGRIRDVRALYWDDESAVAALLPLLEGKIGLGVEGSPGEAFGHESFIGLVYLVVGDGAVVSTLAYGYHLNR